MEILDLLQEDGTVDPSSNSLPSPGNCLSEMYYANPIVSTQGYTIVRIPESKSFA